MLTIFGILTLVLFTNDDNNFKALDAMERNYENGYKWQYVGKQKAQNWDYALPLGDDVIFFHHVER